MAVQLSLQWPRKVLTVTNYLYLHIDRNVCDMDGGTTYSGTYNIATWNASAWGTTDSVGEDLLL